MTVGGENLGGAGRVELLGAIAECGSITQAAKLVKMSYKAAWDAIDAMNNLAGTLKALGDRRTRNEQTEHACEPAPSIYDGKRNFKVREGTVLADVAKTMQK